MYNIVFYFQRGFISNDHESYLIIFTKHSSCTVRIIYNKRLKCFLTKKQIVYTRNFLNKCEVGLRVGGYKRSVISSIE